MSGEDRTGASQPDEGGAPDVDGAPDVAAAAEGPPPELGDALLDPALQEDAPSSEQDMAKAILRATVPARPRRAPRRRRRRRAWRWLLGAGAAAAAGVALLWWAVHRFDWAGPLVADALRAVLGVDAVARLEEAVYGLEDRVHRLTRGGSAPKARWDVPAPATPAAAPSTSASGAPVPGALPPFRPRDVGPVHRSWSAPGDGEWVALEDPRRPGEAPHLYKTLLHPDRNRSWAEVFVVAVDLRRTALHLMPGYQEPLSETPEAKERLLHRSPARPAVIPPAEHDALLGAFNGGFKTEHGHYGMRVDGITLSPPRGRACGIALFPGERLVIADWDGLAPRAEEVLWYRQAPRCMVERGALHPLLSDPGATWWGATLDKETVIRRSAIGVSARGDVLYVSITNATTAQTLALGMRHAGADAVAQLDVNWSYPKFFTFALKAPGGPLIAVPLTKDFDYSEDELLRERAMRDFFYLTRRDAAAARAWTERHEAALLAEAAASASPAPSGAPALPSASASAPTAGAPAPPSATAPR